MTEETPKVLASADINRIMELLPHRYPFHFEKRNSPAPAFAGIGLTKRGADAFTGASKFHEAITPDGALGIESEITTAAGPPVPL